MNSRRVVVTRASHQAPGLVSLLKERGAVPVLYPCIAIEPVEDTRDLDEGIRRLSDGKFDWLVLSSANAAWILSGRLDALGIPLSGIARSKVAAIGPATADAVRSTLGLEVALVPDEYQAENLAEAMSPMEGSRVFLPQANIARPVLKNMLVGAGAEVAAVSAYKTVLGKGGANVPALLKRQEIDAVTFTSSSTVENFARRLDAEGGGLDAVGRVCIACLGHKTAGTAERLGLGVTITAPENTLESLAGSIANHFMNR